MKKFEPRNKNQFKTPTNESGRECTSCGVFKPWSEYNGASKSYTKKQSRCKICHQSNRGPRDKKKELFNAKGHKKKLKEDDPHLWRAGNVRNSHMARAKKLGLDRKDIPTRYEICDWLKEQEPLRCYYTNVPVDLMRMHVDHKVPLSRGGKLGFSNLCVTCPKINSAKGQMTDVEFIGLLELISGWEDGGKYLLMRLRQGFMGKR